MCGVNLLHLASWDYMHRCWL